MSEARIRLTFEKTGRSAYISHLDLMRLLARAMVRAEIPFKHTEGFNPHPYISLARPLALGFEGASELCDFVLGGDMGEGEIVSRMNSVLPEGIKILSAREVQGGVKNIEYSKYEIYLDCDAESVNRLFESPVVVLKRKKKGPPEQTDITPMVKSLRAGSGLIEATLRDAGDGGLNPSYITAAIAQAGLSRGQAKIVRTGFFGADGNEIK